MMIELNINTLNSYFNMGINKLLNIKVKGEKVWKHPENMKK